MLGAGEPLGGIHTGGAVPTEVARLAAVALGGVQATDTEIEVSLLVFGGEVLSGVGVGVGGGVGLPSEPMESVGRPSGGGTMPPTTATRGTTKMKLKSVGHGGWSAAVLFGQPFLQTGAFNLGSQYQTGRIVGVPLIVCVTFEFT